MSVFELPPGWFGFCTRIWLACVLALATAFWLQLESADSAAVCVAILAQPLRGQALSKAIYRLGGTLLGAVVSVALIAAFPQNRFLLLGGAALWLAACTAYGTLQRDFRSYAAMLAGYTVCIVGVSSIGDPQDVFASALSRVAVITVGVVAMTVVNDAFGSPDTWTQLVRSLRSAADKVITMADDAMTGRNIPDDDACAKLASEILALTSQASYARTELQDGRMRVQGANNALVAMLEMISASRAVASVTGGLASSTCRGAQLESTRSGQPLETAEDAFIWERSENLSLQRQRLDDGLAALAEGKPYTPRVVVTRHQDYFACGLNAVRVLLAFTFASAFCILSGFEDSSLALVNVAAMCALSATNPNPTAFAWGVVIGAPIAICDAMLVNFLLLNQGSAMPLLAMAILPHIFIGCILSLRPSTGSVGFIMLVWFFVMLNPSNIQSFDATAYVERGVMLMASAIIVFLSLVLILPASPGRRRFRLFVSVAHDLEEALQGRGEEDAASLITRHYDRLSQALAWSAKLPESPSRKRILARFYGLGDLDCALARARRNLRAATALPVLGPHAGPLLQIFPEARGMQTSHASAAKLEHLSKTLLAAAADQPQAAREAAYRAVSGLHGAALLFRAQEAYLRLTGITGALVP